MRYMLLIYNDEAAMANAPRDKTEQTLAAYGAYTEALKKSGAYLAGERLRPTQAATSIRMANGKTNVLDGPYADTKEQLAGYFLPAGFQDVTSNVVLLATLIFRPSGLFAEIAGKRV